jgi:hypothetical protein
LYFDQLYVKICSQDVAPINSVKNFLPIIVDHEPDTTMCKINPCVDFAISSALDRWTTVSEITSLSHKTSIP